jgi:phosphoserine phosphatase
MNRYLVLIFCFVWGMMADDGSVQRIASWIAESKKAILEAEAQNGLNGEDLLFLAFWNFDNTILDGDSTEGRKDLYGKVIFKGLAEVAIESGFSKKYKSSSKFWKDYEAMEKVDEPKAYAYAAQMLAGAEEKEVLKLATDYFKNALKPYLFQASIDLIQQLQEQNISVMVITASPRIFVQGAAPLLNISINDVYGMETVVKNGRLTDQMVLPLTTRAGKIDKIQLIVQEKLEQYRKIYVLAGFGNYNLNDMPFLNWTAAQKFNSGKPLAVIDYRPPSISRQNTLLLPLVETDSAFWED